MRKIIPGVILALGLMAPAMAQAQTAQTWWVCVAEVPISKTVGMKMSWVGPAGRWNEVHNTYLAGFDTTATYEQALAIREDYAAEYQAFLLKSGYDLTPGISGRTTDVVCLPYKTEAERTQVAAELSVGREEQQGVKLDLRPTYVQWQPTAAKPTTEPTVAATTTVALNATFEDITPQAAALLGLNPAKGAAVMSVDAGGRAEKAGLKPSDVVTEISGQAVEKAADIPAILGRLRAGFMATFHVWRDKAFTDVTIEIPAPTVPPSPYAAEVQTGIDLALAAEQKARARARDAEDAASQAKQMAAKAEAEAQKAEQGQAGYTVGKYRNFGPEMLRYAGQSLNGATPVLGVTTYAKHPDARAAGQTILFTVKTIGTAPVMNGLGIVVLSPTESYAGNLDKGMLNGLGTRDLPGMHYAGDFVGGQMNGLIVITAEKGEVAGDFRDNKLDGYGVVVTSTGARRVGHFTNEAMDGPGIEYAPDGTTQRGIWSGGTLVTPVP